MKQFWSVLGLTTTLATLQLIGFPNQKANVAQAHCRIVHPHHCTPGEVVDDVVDTVDRWGFGAAHPSLIPVSGYLEFLFQQGNGQWKVLPDDFKACYREHYSFNLDDVRYATNVDTVHGQAITVGNEIYFPTDINLSTDEDKHWMFHELEHVQQYQVTGGVSAFLVKYVVQGGIEVGRNGSVDIHDNIGLESEAESKADRMIDISCSPSALSMQNRLYIRSFDGQTFGEVSSSQAVSGADRFRGWSWDGTTASYVAFENGQSTLYIRPFDGQTFGSVSSSQVVSSSDAFRGWSWDGTTASYVTFKPGEQSTLIVRPFDGQTFGSVTSSQVVSSSDAFRGWSWDGTTASYVAVDGTGRSILYIRPFDGRTFGSVTSSQVVSDRDVFRGWSWNGGTASYVAE